MRFPVLAPIGPGHIALKEVVQDLKSTLPGGYFFEKPHFTVYPTVQHAFRDTEWYVVDYRLPMPGDLPEWAVRAWDRLGTLRGPATHLALVSFDGGKSVQVYTVYAYIVEEDGQGYASADLMIITSPPTPSAQA